MLALAGTMVGCSDGFLEQDPLSFYEPATTYSTEAGLQAALAQCDKQLKTYRIDGNWNNVGIFTNYLMSDVGMYAKTDMGGGFQDNFDAKLIAITVAKIRNFCESSKKIAKITICSP